MSDFSAALNPDGLSLIEKARRGLLDNNTLTLEKIASLVVESEDHNSVWQKTLDDLYQAVKEGRLKATEEHYEHPGTLLMPGVVVGGGPDVRYHVHRTRMTELLGPSLGSMSEALRGWLRYVPTQAGEDDEIKKEVFLKRYQGKVFSLKGHAIGLDTWFRNHGPEAKRAQTRGGYYKQSLLLTLLRQSGNTISDASVKPGIALVKGSGKQ